MANKLRVSKSGSGAPTSVTPDFLGQIYIDEDTGTRYEATALTEGSWVDKLSLKENAANKKTNLTDNSDTYYPTQKAVKTAVDAKQDALGYIAENAANKKTSLTDNSDTYYPTQKAVKTAVDAKYPKASCFDAISVSYSLNTPALAISINLSFSIHCFAEVPSFALAIVKLFVLVL